MKIKHITSYSALNLQSFLEMPNLCKQFQVQRKNNLWWKNFGAKRNIIVFSFICFFIARDNMIIVECSISVRIIILSRVPANLVEQPNINKDIQSNILVDIKLNYSSSAVTLNKHKNGNNFLSFYNLQPTKHLEYVYRYSQSLWLVEILMTIVISSCLQICLLIGSVQWFS